MAFLFCPVDVVHLASLQSPSSRLFFSLEGKRHRKLCLIHKERQQAGFAAPSIVDSCV
jgi:hypothetical protein